MGINFLNDKFLFLDGAMGTMLQKSGLKLGERPETLSITNSDLICDIHKQYINAGANIIYANTFGANDLKLKDNEYSLNEVITASINCAKNAVKGTDTQVALDVGPLGEMLKPAGSLSFDDAYNEFKKVVIAGENAGANLVVFETMTDIYEVKAAVLATKENTKLPIFVSMSFEENGRTFQGCPVEAMALVLEGLAVDAVGINCSLGPQEIFPLAKRLCDSTNLPVFVKPNAGLPNLKTGGYDLNPETFAEILKDYISLGVFAVGGCCGTTPDFICETKKVFEKYKPFKRELHFRAAICSGTKYLPLENICVIGERINPTGKKIFREALKNNDMDYILKQAVDQQEAGADILDVNVGTPGIDEPQMMINVVTNLQSVTDLPLQIDSSDPIAVEKALRIYNGKAIVNSVNGEKAVLDKLLPIVKKYGAAVVGLTLDENGIPPKAEERFAIAKHILETALSYGIAKENVLIDCLTLTASAQQAEVAETLKAVRLVKQNLGLKTVLGVSNISFGLPNRELLNHSFLLLAMGEGLDLPILNPNIDSMMSAVRAYRVLYNIDKQSSQYIDAYKDYTPTEQKIQKTSTGTTQDNVQNVTDAIKKGLKKQSADETLKLLSTYEPLQIVNEFLIPALDEVGLQFEKGKLFLPQLLQAADAAGAAFDIIKAQMVKDNTVQTKKETIILATVKGDIHDIGKNIVKVIMENYGYKILDLGKDTPVQTVVDAIIETKAPLVGLSALMTTTLKSMQETINAIKLAKLPCKIMVGGAVLTEEYALEMGADFYAKDAKQSVDIAKKIIG